MGPYVNEKCTPRERHLHDVPPDRSLSLEARLRIAIGVAQALSYLHKEFNSEEAIVHCDVKPSNIFLDSGMEAHVGDFGISKILKAKGVVNTQSCFTGTVGYIPPEYAVFKISVKGDVYSFGFTLLEMLTAKKPTSTMFTDGLTLPNWVRETFPRLRELDPHLRVDSLAKKCIVKQLQLGIICTSQDPEQRPVMSFVMQVMLCIAGSNKDESKDLEDQSSDSEKY